jgi:hypothetical protein
MIADALFILLGVLGIAAGLAVNWLIWFKLLPTIFRQLRKRPN